MKKLLSLATLGRIAVILLLAAVFATALTQQTINNGLLSRGQLPVNDDANQQDQEEQPPLDVALQTKVNHKAHYSFGYPRRWKAATEGTLSRITSPDRKVVISVGLAPAGDISRASSNFLRLLQGSYDRLRVREQEDVVVRQSPAVRLAGTAVNQHNVSLKFEAVTLGAGSRNFTIAAFYDPRTKVRRVGRMVDAVVSSFRLIAPA